MQGHAGVHRWLLCIKRRGRTATTCGRFLGENHLPMQVIGHRHCKEQQDEGDADGGPFLNGMPNGAFPLMDPTRAPSPKDARCHQHPENIEE